MIATEEATFCLFLATNGELHSTFQLGGNVPQDYTTSRHSIYGTSCFRQTQDLTKKKGENVKWLYMTSLQYLEILVLIKLIATYTGSEGLQGVKMAR